MKTIFNTASLLARTNHELEGMKEQIRNEIGNCEQQRRKGYAVLADIRTVQAHRRTSRANV